MDAAELWGVKVAVLHMNDDSNKVPLDGDLLVSYLNGGGRAGTVVQSHHTSLSSSSRGALSAGVHTSYNRWHFLGGTEPLGGKEPASFHTKVQP